MNDLSEKIEYRVIPKAHADRYIDLATGENLEAKSYLHHFLQVIEGIDDVMDGDGEKMNVDGKHQMFFNLLTGFSLNPFVLANYLGLTALHTVIYNAWVISDEIKWANDSPENQIYGNLLADLYGELFCYVGFLTGGYARMRAVSREIRLEYLTERGDTT